MGINIGTTGVDEIYVGEGTLVDDYSAMQGPAPDGFHIPLDSEFQDLVAMMNSIGIDSDTQGSSYSEYLKIPLAGYRSGVDSTVSEIGEDACLWASSAGWGMFAEYFLLYPGLGEYEADVTDRGRVDGCSLRCFKDTPVAPDSSWTNLYGTNTAGIFHNTTLGLISIVDGNDIITIADKNVGATTVWNAGDTLTSNNCGNYYQRGNNYGFPFTGTVTTSSTQVDASSYGPGNYYSSSTFIESENDRRSSVPNDNLRGGETGVQQRHIGNVKEVYVGTTKVRPATPVEPPYLCFTANTAGSTVQLTKNGSPTVVTLETSTDGNTWTTYTMGDTITLTNIGDKVYWRNTNTSGTQFNTSSSDYYMFVMTGSIRGSGDAGYLISKNSVTTVSSYCFYRLFRQCQSLTTAPSLPATGVANYCYANMFVSCSNLETIVELPAEALRDYCYMSMFSGCSKIKLSTAQTGTYQTAYRIPSSGTGSVGSSSLTYMFRNTGGTFTGGTPSINTTYYTSNTVV